MNSSDTDNETPAGGSGNRAASKAADSSPSHGSDTLMRCSRCSHVSLADSAYCASCGTDLSDSGVPLALEATQVHTPVTPDAASAAATAQLIIQGGAKAGTVFALNDAVTTVGRHPESDIFLSDLTVSRRHAEIHASEGGFEVRDCGSLNGTYIDRQRVEAAWLKEGDIVQVGRFKLEYSGPADQAGSESAGSKSAGSGQMPLG